MNYSIDQTSTVLGVETHEVEMWLELGAARRGKAGQGKVRQGMARRGMAGHGVERERGRAVPEAARPNQAMEVIQADQTRTTRRQQ